MSDRAAELAALARSAMGIPEVFPAAHGALAELERGYGEHENSTYWYEEALRRLKEAEAKQARLAAALRKIERNPMAHPGPSIIAREALKAHRESVQRYRETYCSGLLEILHALIDGDITADEAREALTQETP